MKKLISILLLAAAFTGIASAAEKVRIGYWTSGVSLGYGTLMENKKFLEQDGVEVEYVRFPELLAQVKALATGDIDIGYAVPFSGTIHAINDGVPVKIVAATQLADAVLVAHDKSPVKSWKDLKGKKVGASNPNAAVTALAHVIADKKYGVKKDEYTIIAGNEGRLVQFLAQGQVDAAIIRTFTYEQVGKELKLRKLGTLPEEWQSIPGNKTAPYIGTGIVRTDYLEKHPDTVAKVVKSWIKLDQWGRANKKEAVSILKKSGLAESNVQALANRWDVIFRTSLNKETLKTLQQEYEGFVNAGVVKGQFSEKLYSTEPYIKASSRK